ncbi:MAG: Hpt domain-containing protein [Deltaproteobacteria bacterium]|nr:Hpt domain-containing protein [Deltaproteobacteria bacterium]
MTDFSREGIIKDMQAAADRMGLDLEDLQEMIVEVIDDCLTKAKAIVDAIDKSDADNVKKIAHDIKGSSANYGLLAASETAKQIEHGAKDLPKDLALLLVSQLEAISKIALI